MNREYEYKVNIDGRDYSMDSLTSASFEQPLFDSFGVGNACAAQLTLSYYDNNINPATMAQIIAYCRKRGSTDAWSQLGVFFVDTRETSTDRLTTLTCYDSMLKADQKFLSEVVEDNWPQKQTKVVADICTRMSVELDARTVINPNYNVDIPVDLNIRDILCYIAAANGGNWIITAANKLLLVPLFSSMPAETYLLIADDGDRITFGGVRIIV